MNSFFVFVLLLTAGYCLIVGDGDTAMHAALASLGFMILAKLDARP